MPGTLSEGLVLRSSGRVLLEKGNCNFSTKQNPPNTLLMCVYLSVGGIPIPCKETKGPEWQVNEHPLVVPLIPKEQVGEFTSKLVNCN